MLVCVHACKPKMEKKMRKIVFTTIIFCHNWKLLFLDNSIQVPRGSWCSNCVWVFLNALILYWISFWILYWILYWSLNDHVCSEYIWMPLYWISVALQCSYYTINPLQIKIYHYFNAFENVKDLREHNNHSWSG